MRSNWSDGPWHTSRSNERAQVHLIGKASCFFRWIDCVFHICMCIAVYVKSSQQLVGAVCETTFVALVSLRVLTCCLEFEPNASTRVLVASTSMCLGLCLVCQLIGERNVHHRLETHFVCKTRSDASYQGDATAVAAYLRYTSA